MKRKQIVITDLDETFVHHDYEKEVEKLCKYIEIPYSKEIEEQFYEFIADYEKILKGKRITKRSVKEAIKEKMPSLCAYITESEFLEKWIEIDNTVYTKASEYTLKKMKEKGYKIVAFTDWFREAQIKRLDKLGYLPYFDQIYGWEDSYVKPDIRALERIVGKNAKEDYILIGDSLEKDILCANQGKVTSVWFNPKKK